MYCVFSRGATSARRRRGGAGGIDLSRELPTDFAVAAPFAEGLRPFHLDVGASAVSPVVASRPAGPLISWVADHVFFHPFLLREAGGLSVDPVIVYWNMAALSGSGSPVEFVHDRPLFDYRGLTDSLGGSRKLLMVRREIWDHGFFDFLRGVSATDSRRGASRFWMAVADERRIRDPLSSDAASTIPVVMFGIAGGEGSLRFREAPGVDRPFLWFSRAGDPTAKVVAGRRFADDHRLFDDL